MPRCRTFQGKPCQDVKASRASREEHVLVEPGPCCKDILDTASGGRFPDFPVQQQQRPGSASELAGKSPLTKIFQGTLETFDEVRVIDDKGAAYSLLKSVLRRLTVWRERHSVQFYTYLVSGMRHEILPRLLWEEQVRTIALLRIRHDTRETFITINQVIHGTIHQRPLFCAVQQE